VLCYEDNRLLKLFSDIVKMLYNGDIVGEDTIQHWFRGQPPQGQERLHQGMQQLHWAC